MNYNPEKARTVVDRIRSLRKAHGLTQVALARQLQVTQSIVSLVESGKSAVSINFLKKLASQFDVSLDWLVHGRELYSRYDSSKFLPFVDRKVHADYIDNHKNTDYLHTLKLYKIPGFENGEFRLFEVTGNSMVPSIYEHDKLIVSAVAGLSAVLEGTINVLVTEEDIVVKRVYFDPEQGRDLLILRSDNGSYHDMKIAANRIKEVWKVEAKITNSFLKENVAINERISDLEGNISELKEELHRLMDTVVQKEK